jgi:uncharacterized protein YndB with AHSA1/START domain
MSTTTTNQKRAEITIDANVPIVRIVREFDAPPENVFRSHVDADLFAIWNGPCGTTMRVDRHDCRERRQRWLPTSRRTSRGLTRHVR